MNVVARIAVLLVSGSPLFASDLAGTDDTGNGAAEAMYANSCAQCHGRTGRGMASFPALAGRDAAHISDRLTQYRAGEPIGPNSALMMPVAAELSDGDIARLSAYIAESFR